MSDLEQKLVMSRATHLRRRAYPKWSITPRERQRQTESDRQTERQSERQTIRQRQRDRQTETDRDIERPTEGRGERRRSRIPKTERSNIYIIIHIFNTCLDTVCHPGG